jgi:16S rRNA G1207 methylase RsmC
MKIETDNTKAFEAELEKFKRAGWDVSEVTSGYGVLSIWLRHENGAAVEVVPSNDWAFVHGSGELEGLGTTIVAPDELEESIQRLHKAHSERTGQ